MYEHGRKYISNNYLVQWDNYFKIYKQKRVMRHYDGLSDPVLPETHTIIETLVANIAGSGVHFHFVKTNEEQTDDIAVLNGQLDYYLACNNIGLVNQEWVRDMLIYGTGILYITWENDKPRIQNIPIRDFFVNPQATALVNPDGSPNAMYAGFVYLGDKDTMKRELIYDPEQDKMVPKYDPVQLDRIGFATAGAAGNTKITDKQYKDQFNGSTLGVEAPLHQVFIAKLYDLNSGMEVEIGNDKEIIFSQEIPFQRDQITKTVQVQDPTNPGNMIPSKKVLDKIDPFLPFAVLRDYVDTSQFYGGGEIELIADRAEELNDLESMDIDNLAYQNTPMYQIDPQFADLAPEIETIPGAVYPIPKNAISSMPIAEIAGNLDEKKDRVRADMRSATGADEAIQGTMQNKGRTTATEVSQVLGQAQTRFATKIQNLEQEGYAQLGRILVKMIQIFVTEQQVVRIVGTKGVQFKDYDPYEFNGEWEPHVELDSTTKQRQLEVGQKLNQIFERMTNNPIFDPVESNRWIFKQIDPEMSDETFNNMLAKAPPGPSAEEQKSSYELQKAEYSAIATIYQYASPFVRSEIETILHMQPDPMHEAEEQTNQMEHGARQADFLNPNTNADNNPEPTIPQAPTPAAQPAGMQPSQ